MINHIKDALLKPRLLRSTADDFWLLVAVVLAIAGTFLLLIFVFSIYDWIKDHLR